MILNVVVCVAADVGNSLGFFVLGNNSPLGAGRGCSAGGGDGQA